VEVKAFAKINLSLEVLGRRSDGYHEVKTVLQTVDLADRLYFTPAQDIHLECSVSELNGEDNLVWRAADALRRASGCDKGAKIYLEKNIPVGMGLGGGSSDAAAALKALNHLWGLDVGEKEMQSIAASLGSDVPFFLDGGTALGEGRGEVISALPPMPRSWLVLLCPDLPLRGEGTPHKTARLYSALTGEHYTDGSHTRKLVDSLEKGMFSPELLFNAFEQVAPLVFRGFERMRRFFRVKRCHLSGSGPGLYTFVSSQEEGAAVLKPLKEMGLEAYCVSTETESQTK
jgi:4-diphosphocytidyl-2-C-methyl-D-erythritol kinase